MNSITLHFPADYPTAAGHFPGNPIIPGAVLLDAAIAVIATALAKPAEPCEIVQAKFPHPVRPGDKVMLEWAGDETILFTASLDNGRAVLAGKVSFAC